MQQTMRVGGQVEVGSATQLNGEMPVPKTEPLEPNPELGVYFMQENQDGDGNREVYFTQFNHRLSTTPPSAEALTRPVTDPDPTHTDVRPQEQPRLLPPTRQDMSLP